MPDEEHLKILKQGVEQWNKWRLENAIRPDLSSANLIGADLIGTDLIDAYLSFTDLSGANLSGAKLSGTNLIGAYLSGAYLGGAYLSGTNLIGAYLSGAYLSGAYLIGAYLSGANLIGANLSGAYLGGAYLSGANLTSADLSDADLSRTGLVETDFTNATITGCRTYGASVWNVTLVGTVQHNLVITKEGEPVVTVDGLEVGQFIYLLLNNQNVRKIIDTVTSKVVLILGRFTEPRKAVLDAIRERLRRSDFTPVIFDFDKPSSKEVTGTVETLARLARFIIADLTEPSSIPDELATVVPFLRTTPVLPLKLVGSGGYSMFDDFSDYTWVLKTHEYKDGDSLIADLAEVIAPAEEMATNFRKHVVG
jgi:Pentapeptide repeats (8 copies)